MCDIMKKIKNVSAFLKTQRGKGRKNDSSKKQFIHAWICLEI